jgi:hypothetical protein
VFGLQIIGLAMPATALIRIATLATECGHPDTSRHSSHLDGPLARRDRLYGAIGRTRDAATSQVWTDLVLAINATFQVCWCGVEVCGVEDFNVVAGLINVGEALSAIVAGTAGFSMRLTGEYLEAERFGVGQLAAGAWPEATVAIRYKLLASGAGEVPLLGKREPGALQFEVGISQEGIKHRLILRLGGPEAKSWQLEWSPATEIPMNEWHHVAFTWSPNATRLFLDGVLDQEIPGWLSYGAPVGAAQAPLRIAATGEPGAPRKTAPLEVDDIGIWAEALGQSAVRVVQRCRD